MLTNKTIFTLLILVLLNSLTTGDINAPTTKQTILTSITLATGAINTPATKPTTPAPTTSTRSAPENQPKDTNPSIYKRDPNQTLRNPSSSTPTASSSSPSPTWDPIPASILSNQGVCAAAYSAAAATTSSGPENVTSTGLVAGRGTYTPMPTSSSTGTSPARTSTASASQTSAAKTSAGNKNEVRKKVVLTVVGGAVMAWVAVRALMRACVGAPDFGVYGLA